MAISLYDLSVPSYLQITGAVEGFLARAATHFKDNNIDVGTVVDHRLFSDMLPFRFQIVAVAHHSIGAIRGIKAGLFGPPAPLGELDFAGLQKMVTEARDELQKIKPDEVNACEGKDVVFQMRDTKIPFTAEGFIQSFSMPNFFFHATTAYDILRTKGVPLGKRDFLGRMRLKS